MSGRLLSRAIGASRQEFPIGDVAQIGSGAAADVVLSGPGVAAVHATITREGDRMWLAEAAESQSAGVLLNGARIRRERLHHLDVITVSGIDLVFVEP
jgi:pSer/pThr/pTyr-binding forkhead associated (FHA) protein